MLKIDASDTAQLLSYVRWARLYRAAKQLS